jgi:hypothetical protein
MCPTEATPVDERLKATREFFHQFRKAAKTLGMYQHNPERFVEFVRPTHNALKHVLRDGPLVLRVSAQNFLLGDQPAWPEDAGETIPYRLFREGVRQLGFKPGFADTELVSLIRIMLTPTERTGEEMVAQLWAANLTHFEYRAVEGFALGELTEEQVQAQVDRLVRRLAGGAGADSGPGAFGGGSGTTGGIDQGPPPTEAEQALLEDLEPGLVLPSVEIGAPDQLEAIHLELDQDDAVRLPRQSVELSLRLLFEGRFTDPNAAATAIGTFIDELYIQPDGLSLVKLLDVLKKLSEDQGPTAPRVRAMREAFSAQLGEPERLRGLLERLHVAPSPNPIAARRLLEELPASAAPQLTEVLAQVQAPELRVVVLDVLAKMGPNPGGALVERLSEAQPGQVRDLLAVLQRSNPAELPKALTEGLRHNDPKVRAEVLSSLGNTPNPESIYRFLQQGTADPDPSVRAAAFDALVKAWPQRGATDLFRLLKLADWDKRDPAEKERIHIWLGRTGQPEALKHFAGLLAQKRSLLNGRKVTESKLWAIAGLQEMATIQAFKLLQQEVEANDSDVVAAARRAMYTVKKAIFGPGGASTPEKS